MFGIDKLNPKSANTLFKRLSKHVVCHPNHLYHTAPSAEKKKYERPDLKSNLEKVVQELLPFPIQTS